MRVFYTLLAASAHLMSPTGAYAAGATTDEPAKSSVVVKAGDLDLTDAADRRRLNHRIATAASRVCRRVVSDSDLHEVARCQAEALRGARTRSKDLIVRAFYAKAQQRTASRGG